MAADDVDLRCSMQARGAGLEPVGTAGTYDAFLLVEVSLPWPKEITDHPALEGVADVVAPIGARVQGVVPAPDQVADGQSSLTLYRRAPGRFRRYERQEVCVAPDALVAGATALLDAAPAADDVVDLLVCTHGARDRCCGAFGMSLFASVGSRPGLRVRRTSHTGGHRFAPTAILLPQGTAWAWLDDTVLDAILDRSREPAELLPHYRGSTALGPAPVQAAERAVFAEVGWPWLDADRDGRVVESVDDRSVVQLDSTVGSWEAVVVSDGMAPQPVCGAPPGSEKKADPQLRVAHLGEIG